MCIVAPSGSGKTNFLLNLLKVFSQGRGTFISIDIITSNKDEPLYNYLSGEFDGIRISEGMQSTPRLDDMDKKYNHLVVWDDLVLSKDLRKVEEYYMRARKQNCSVIFLSQSYYDIPKFIRKNSNYLVLLNLNGSKREQTAILNEWGTDLTKEQLNKIYLDATQEQFRPLIITGGKIEPNKKYRKGWNDYYNIESYLNENLNLKKTALSPKKTKKKTKKYDSSESESDY
jgi:ABC-type dipeptide/oligopeptide/nickel transport system ATPase component